MAAEIPADIPFVGEAAPAYGVATQVAPLVRRVVARNPSPYTYWGTVTYIVGRGRVAVIDPGPDLPEHVDALMAALEGERVSHILVTHAHRDHSPAAAPLKARTGATTCGFGPHRDDRLGPAVEEGADPDFAPDERLADGDAIAGEGWTIEAVHTPGHTSNHLCFALVEERALFSGDHVMAWSTSVISPPDGDMGAYMASLDKLLGRDDRVLWPAHGPAVRDPKPFVRAFIAHRRAREAEIMTCLREGRTRIPEMVAAIYTDVPRQLHPAAARSVLAHLVHMVETGRVRCAGPPDEAGRYSAAPDAVGNT